MALAGGFLGCAALAVAVGTRGVTPRGAARGATALSLAMAGAVVALAHRSAGRFAFRLVLGLALLDVAQLLAATRSGRTPSGRASAR